MWTHTHTSSLPLSFPGGSVVKNLPLMQEMRVQSLGHKGPLKECMATHSSILAGKPHGWRSLAGYGPWWQKQSDMTYRLSNIITC